MVTRPQRHDQTVVGNLPVRQDDAPSLWVETHRLAEENPHIRLSLEDVPEGGSDVGGREPTRGDLVEEGLKQMEIPAIQQGHPHRRPRKRPRGAEPAEPAPQDDDPMPGCRVGPG